MKPWSKSTFVACVSAVLAVALIQPVVAGPVQIPAGFGWVKTASDPSVVLDAISSHGSKLPPEFKQRLKNVLDDGTLQVMVALNRRDAEVERFMVDNTSWLKWYGNSPRFLGHVTPDQLATLLSSPSTDFVEPDYRIKNFLSTSTLDVHARSLNSAGNGVWSFDAAAGPRGALTSDIPGLSADVATGKGVTVQITDSGIDRTHKDFSGWGCDAGPYQPCSSRIVKTVSVDHLVETGADPSDSLPTSEAASGHGTHVAGIIAGNAYYTRDGDVDATRYGADGHNFGVAPQANLISVKNGDTLWAGLSSFALQWTLDHADEYNIRASSNSWGCLGGCSFNGSSADGQLFKDLYNAGVVVTFAAGNDGGGTDGQSFSGAAQSPYVLGVANYNDAAAKHQLSSTSSRGVGTTTLADPSTWTPEGEPVNGVRRPDVAAPGESIWSARTLTGGAAAGTPRANVNDALGGGSSGFVPYAQMSGTSMATPHVSGAAALLFSACPDAAPLDVMRAVMAGADPNDVSSTDGSRNALPYEAGYGALEIRRSIDWLLARNCDSANAGGGGTDPTPTETATATPTNCPTTSAPSGPSVTTQYYFHSLDPIGNVGWLDASSTYDTTAPTESQDSYWVDVPLVGNGGVATNPWDPFWTGDATGPVNGLNVDFWQQAPLQNTTLTITYNVSLWVGDTQYEMPQISTEAEIPQTEPVRVQASFTELRDGTPLNIDTGDGPVTITIAGQFVNEEFPGAIVYGSAAHPSGFSITSGGAPDPTPTCSPSGSPTASPTDPGPTGTRGTYPTDPNDPLFADQWGMAKIQAPQAWQEEQATGFGTKVAVLDTGLDLGHPDFNCPGKVQIIQDNDFIGDGNGPQDGAGHGTHTAGIVGACSNNNEGVVGVAPDTTIMPVQVLDATGNGTITETLPGAIHAATDAGANVISMSLGTLEVNTPIDVLFGEVFPEVEEAIDYAISNGVVVVAAAGNTSFPMCSYPAIVEDIVCVGATDRNDLNAWYGNFPVNDDDDNETPIGAGLVAPGGQGTLCEEGVVSTFLRTEESICYSSGYDSIDGTSMATPHVAGVAALVYDRLGGVRNEANGRAIVNAIINSTDDLYAPGWDPMSGYGRLNALKAVQAVDPVAPPVTIQQTSLAFTDASDTSGQHSDSATIEAVLKDDAGNPISGADIAFEFTGADGTDSFTVTTDDAGLASHELALDSAPGSYSLSARYAGLVDEYAPSANLAGFVIEKDDSKNALSIVGKSSNRQLWAKLVDTDSSTGLTGRVVEFFADGKSLGTSVTDSSGTATLSIPAKYGNGHISFKSVFNGDANYLGSVDSRQT